MSVEGGVIQWRECGGAVDSTNNRMELEAIIAALRRLPEGDQHATVYSDSSLCVKTLNEWAMKWEKAGWKKGGKSEPKNLDLVQLSFSLKKLRPNVKIVWIKAHDGSTWNEYADALATFGLESHNK